MAKKTEKVPVSARALVARLNRAMHDDDIVVRRTRPEGRARSDLGEYYLVNFRINGICGKYVDLEELAREYGAIKDYEALADE